LGAHLSLIKLADAQRQWYGICAELTCGLFLLGHISPGPVPRGTEAETLLAWNTSVSSRTIFAINGYIASAISYSKTQHILKTTKIIPRFYPFEVARLLLLYLIIVRPLEKLWAKIAFGQDHAQHYRSRVFVSYGIPLTSVDFSEIMVSSTREDLNIPLGLADYRQVIKVVLRVLFGMDPDDDDEENEVQAIDHGFGHNTTTGRRCYGRLLYSDLPRMTSEVITICQKGCQRVHQWLDNTPSRPSNPLDPGRPVPPVDANARYPEISKDALTSIIQEETRKAFENTCKTLEEARKTLEETRKALEETLQIAKKEEGTRPALTSGIPLRSIGKRPWVDSSPVIVQPATLSAIRRLFKKPDAHFKSVSQGRILELIRQGDKHVLGVLPTGGGKSAAFFGPAFLESNGITVVIVPFNALLQDLIAEGKKMGVKVATWPDKISNPNLKSGVDYIPLDVNHHRVVLVSAHDAGGVNFPTWLRNLGAEDLLRRIVIDEVHEVLVSQDYRHGMKNLKVVVEMGVQIIGLTATLSPSSELDLLQFFSIPPTLSITIREPTHRPEISYHFTKTRDFPSMLDLTKEVVSKTKLEDHERGLIFAHSYEDCDLLSKTLQIPKYYGKMSPVEKSNSFQKWTVGKYKWMVATSALGHGINYKFVRYVLHFRAPTEILQYAQETGRGGRDGRKAIARTIYTTPATLIDSLAPDTCGRVAMQRLISLDTQCRRIEQSLFLDGEAITCSSLPGSQLCDVCQVYWKTIFHYSLASKEGSGVQRSRDRGPCRGWRR
jgi:hypothetical protein